MLGALRETMPWRTFWHSCCNEAEGKALYGQRHAKTSAWLQHGSCDCIDSPESTETRCSHVGKQSCSVSATRCHSLQLSSCLCARPEAIALITHHPRDIAAGACTGGQHFPSSLPSHAGLLLSLHTTSSARKDLLVLFRIHQPAGYRLTLRCHPPCSSHHLQASFPRPLHRLRCSSALTQTPVWHAFIIKGAAR